MTPELKEKMQEAAENYAHNLWKSWKDNYESDYMCYKIQSEIDFNAGAQAMHDEFAPLVEWVSVEERLPENSITEKYLVKFKNNKGIEQVGLAKYFDIGIGNGWTIFGNGCRKVTHWRKIEL